MATKNPITNDLIQSRMNSKAFEENFDRIFRRKEVFEELAKTVEENEALLYELDDGQLTDEQYAKINELAEYELNKSTGEVEKRFIDGVSKPNESQFDE